MNLDSKIIELNHQKKYEELINLVENTKTEELIDTATRIVGQSNETFISYWDAILIATDNLTEKRFKIVSAVLDLLNKVVITHKHAFDIISRLFIDLPKFTPAQLIEFTEYCTESMRCGDPKCVGWKDLFPPVLTLVSDYQKVMVNGIATTGFQFRQQCINTLIMMKWPSQILTPIAMMFREMPINKDERSLILGKFTDSLQGLDPTELPPLANQLFALTTTVPLVMMTLFSLQKYFHTFYYKKLFMDMEIDSMTDSDSIDPCTYSEKEMREAEETILYYLSKSTQYNITEEQIVANCRALGVVSKYFLTPFMLNSLFSMCNINRDPSPTSGPTNSPVLLFLRNVIKNNEMEKKMCTKSAWCKDISDTYTIDLNKIFSILIDQSKESSDAVTPGIVSLAFVLLKAKDSPELNTIGMSFLEKFVKKRFIFGQGIVKEIVHLMIVNQDCPQYVECLTRLSLTCTLTVSECIRSISHMLENMLLIPGQNAIEMVMAISPLIKISDKIRDLFIDVLRQAIYDRNVSTQQMGVHGLCVVLKMLRDNNSRRARTGNANLFTQPTLSGFSLASQLVQSNRTHKSRHFDMLSLEILGVLKKCFNQTSCVKVTLYEGLSRAIDFNPKLIPHLLPFLIYHFVQYFDISDLGFNIKFGKIVRERSEYGFDIWDNLGQLVFLMGRIVILARSNDIQCEMESAIQTLDDIANKIDVLTVEQLGLVERLDEKTSHIGVQYLATIEGIMAYALHSASKDNSYMTKVLRLYKHHADILKKLTAGNVTKKVRKARNADVSASTSAATSRPVTFQPENIWDLPTIEKFLQIIYEDEVSFATSNQLVPLRTNIDFVCFIVKTAAQKVEKLYKDPQNRQLTYSKSAFNHLCAVARLTFAGCVTNLTENIEQFDLVSAELSIELFLQCLTAGDILFKRKLSEFLKSIITDDAENVSQSIIEITKVIQKHVETLVDNNKESENRIVVLLLKCLDVLYNNFPESDSNTMKAYRWVHQMASDHDVSNRNMNLLHKLLFDLRMQNSLGSYCDSVAFQVSEIFSQHEEVTYDGFELKSLTTYTVETCTTYLCQCLRRQIEDVEYFITKAKGLHSKLKISGQSPCPSIVQSMKTIERKICSQLIHICNAATHLANSHISLGICMDHVKRLLIQLYVCLTNVTKYLILRHTVVEVSCQSIQFDQLMRAAGRSLSQKVYHMISYIEEKQKPEKVIREAKFLPKLVLRIETFNKYVIHLGKKTKFDLSTFIHIGRVRYFRIKDLQDVLDRTMNNADIDVDESNLNEQEQDDDLISDLESIDDNASEKSSTSSAATRESDVAPNPKAKLLQNMKRLNQSTKRARQEKEAPPAKRRKTKSKAA